MDTRAQDLAVAILADRERLGISQEQIAEYADVTQQAVSGWEAGETLPRKARLEKLVEFLGWDSQTAKILKSHGLLYEGTMGAMGGRGARGPKSASGVSMERLILSQSEYEQPDMNDVERSSKRVREISAEVRAMIAKGDLDKLDKQESSSRNSAALERETERDRLDIIDALNRAQNGVKLARQVLEDAERQLGRALSSIKQ